MSTSIVVAARVSTPYGWLYLGQDTQFRIAAGSFENQQTTFRRSEVTSPFVEGKFVINALRENVTESLKLIVEPRLALPLTDAVRAVSAALSQVRYTVQVQIRRDILTWQAYAADHTVSTKREFLHANLVEFNAEIPRDPQVQYERYTEVLYSDLEAADITNAALARYLLSYDEISQVPEIVAATNRVAWPVPEVI